MDNVTFSSPASERRPSPSPSASRVLKIAFLVVNMVLFTGAFVPVLVNVLVSHRMDWSWYPLGAIVMVWLILAPWFVLRRHRAAISWCMAAISVPLYLRLVAALVPAGGWFWPLGLPAAVVGLVGLGAIVWLWRYSRIHPLYASALTFLILALVNVAEILVTRPFLDPDPYQWIRSLVAFSLMGIAVLLGLTAASVRGSRVRKNS